MIVSLHGIVLEKLLHTIILEVHGVGYGVVVPVGDHGILVSGSDAKLYIHEHIRDDAHDLYGFINKTSQELFEQLLTAKGVGPKGAMSILSVGSPQEIRSAIARGDTAYIARASGVGKRVAERIVVDLKDKVGLPSSGDAVSFLNAPSVQDEAVQALMALGYSEFDAVKALEGVDTEMTTEQRIKKALTR